MLSYENNKYVITHGFTKKQQKTPKREVKKALHRRDAYEGRIDMSKIDQYIAKRSKKSAVFAQEYKDVNQQMQVAVEVRNLRDKLGMTQREFAELVKKPQSTIARIESGKMNVSINVLNEIADATHQKLTVKFEPVTA